MTSSPSHFKGKDALDHVAEAQAKGAVSAAEIHGTELPGHISAAADAARETALALLLFWTLFQFLGITSTQSLMYLAIFSLAWIAWKAGRSGWLAWVRLERLHRIVSQERWEIEHHRHQERDELRVLYAAKGFEGKLLEDVLDVLMADNDRLLRVMVEEELGLTLESHEHPLKQALGAFLGALLATIFCLAGAVIDSTFGILIGALLVIGLSAWVAATHEQNRRIPAVIWNIALAGVAFGICYFLLQLVRG